MKFRIWASFRSRLLYPAVFLSCLPLYALLTFGLGVPFAFAVIGTVIGLTVCFTALEVDQGLFLRNRRARPRRALDAYYIVMGVIVSTLLVEIYVTLGTWIGDRFTFVPDLNIKPVLLECILAILLMDFCAYWIHRLQHRSEGSILWRSHSVHHALPILDVVAGAQVHVFDGMVSASPLLLLAAIGFSPQACGAAFVMNLVSAGIHHTDVKTDLRWFNFVTIAPQTHQWHHADLTEKTVNYGFVLAVWDILFGTFSFKPRHEPTTYGARSIETFPDSVTGHLLVGTTAKTYQQLVKADLRP